MATSMGCIGRFTVPVTASASVIECAMVKAVMMVTMSRVTCAEARRALPLAIDRAHHRGQQQQQHERDVVVADEHVPDAFADEAREAAPGGGLLGLDPRGLDGAEHAGELFSPRVALSSTRCEASPLMNSEPPTTRKSALRTVGRQCHRQEVLLARAGQREVAARASAQGAPPRCTEICASTAELDAPRFASCTSCQVTLPS